MSRKSARRGPEPNEVCPVCEKSFFSTGRRYCSKPCADAAWADQHPNVPVRRPGRHRDGSDMPPAAKGPDAE